jgi:hypothetical protein
MEMNSAEYLSSTHQARGFVDSSEMKEMWAR